MLMRSLLKRSKASKRFGVPKFLLIGMAIVLALALASVAYAVIVQEGDITIKPNKTSTKKKLVNAKLRVQFNMHDDTGVKPPALKKVTIRLNKDGKYNGRYLKHKCQLPKLFVEGPNRSCKKAIIGRGTADADARPFLESVFATVFVFHADFTKCDLAHQKVDGQVPCRTKSKSASNRNRDLIIVYAIPDIGPVVYTLGTVTKKRMGKYGYEMVYWVPIIPTLPNKPLASVVEFDATTYKKWVKKGKKKVPLIQTPTTCKKGKWWGQITFTYRNGETASGEASKPCKKSRR